MSSVLIYDSFSIKVGNDILIPMLLAGDSNLFESYNGRERRCRDWSNSLSSAGLRNVAYKNDLDSYFDEVLNSTSYFDSLKNKTMTNSFTKESWLRFIKRLYKKTLNYDDCKRLYGTMFGQSINPKSYDFDTAERHSLKTEDDILEFINKCKDDNKFCYLYLPYGNTDKILNKGFKETASLENIDETTLYNIKYKGEYLIGEYDALDLSFTRCKYPKNDEVLKLNGSLAKEYLYRLKRSFGNSFTLEKYNSDNFNYNYILVVKGKNTNGYFYDSKHLAYYKEDACHLNLKRAKAMKKRLETKGYNVEIITINERE